MRRFSIFVAMLFSIGAAFAQDSGFVFYTPPFPGGTGSSSGASSSSASPVNTSPSVSGDASTANSAAVSANSSGTGGGNSNNGMGSTYATSGGYTPTGQVGGAGSTYATSGGYSAAGQVGQMQSGPVVTPCMDVVQQKAVHDAMVSAGDIEYSTSQQLPILQKNATACQTSLNLLRLSRPGSNASQTQIAAYQNSLTAKEGECRTLSDQTVSVQAQHDQAVKDRLKNLATLNRMNQACGYPTNADSTTGLSNGQEDPCGVIALCSLGATSQSACNSDKLTGCVKGRLSGMMPLSSYNCGVVMPVWLNEHEVCRLQSLPTGGGLF